MVHQEVTQEAHQVDHLLVMVHLLDKVDHLMEDPMVTPMAQDQVRDPMEDHHMDLVLMAQDLEDNMEDHLDSILVLLVGMDQMLLLKVDIHLVMVLLGIQEIQVEDHLDMVPMDLLHRVDTHLQEVMVHLGIPGIQVDIHQVIHQDPLHLDLNQDPHLLFSQVLLPLAQILHLQLLQLMGLHLHQPQLPAQELQYLLLHQTHLLHQTNLLLPPLPSHLDPQELLLLTQDPLKPHLHTIHPLILLILDLLDPTQITHLHLSQITIHILHLDILEDHQQQVMAPHHLGLEELQGHTLDLHLGYILVILIHLDLNRDTLVMVLHRAKELLTDQDLMVTHVILALLVAIPLEVIPHQHNKDMDMVMEALVAMVLHLPGVHLEAPLHLNWRVLMLKITHFLCCIKSYCIIFNLILIIMFCKIFFH